MGCSLINLNPGDEGIGGPGFMAIEMDFFSKRTNTFTLFIPIINQGHLRKFWTPRGNAVLPT